MVWLQDHPSLLWFKGRPQCWLRYMRLLWRVQRVREWWARLWYRPKRVVFTKITTPDFVKDVDQLRSYNMDLREVFTHNADESPRN